MIWKALSCVVACYLVLPGCTSLRSGQELPCNARVCFASVTVSGNCTDANNIAVSPDPIPIGRGNHEPEIHWDISPGSAGHTFAPVPNGIVIVSPPPPAGEFHDPTLASNGTKYILKDKNSAPQTYKYTINLLHNGAACAPKDPSIMNQ
jgi:hypothetical protein